MKMLPAMERCTRNVWVVEPNTIERERLAAALEREGFQAFLCSGPTQPDDSCLGARAGRRHPETDALLTAVWQLASPNGTSRRASEKDERL